MDIWELLVNIGLSVMILCTVIAIGLVVLQKYAENFNDLPPPNSTQEWKMILSQDGCQWYQFGCQSLACVIDCKEINENANETICVC